MNSHIKDLSSALFHYIATMGRLLDRKLFLLYFSSDAMSLRLRTTRKAVTLVGWSVQMDGHPNVEWGPDDAISGATRAKHKMAGEVQIDPSATVSFTNPPAYPLTVDTWALSSVSHGLPKEKRLHIGTA